MANKSLTQAVANEYFARAGDKTSRECMLELREKGYDFSERTFRRRKGAYLRGETPDLPGASLPDKPREPVIGGELMSPEHRRASTTSRTLVFTCAQNNTRLHDKFWQSLMHLVDYKEAELHVARITYSKSGHNGGSAKPGSKRSSDNDEMWWDERIVPYISDQSVKITDSLIWCGELNILPTRVHPLSTLLTYTRKASGIVPHVKMAMESTPVMKGAQPRFMYTTGAVTQRNYIQKAAGQVAEFHHVFGALIVEIESDGQWWVRQLNADSEGIFYDKTTRYSPQGVSHGWPVECMVHGDVHIGKKNDRILKAVFSRGGVVDQLRPTQQFFHDIVDFTPRNHHNIGDPHFRWSKEAQVPVKREFEQAADLLWQASRPWSNLHVVLSNHDVAINHWLKNTTAFYDSDNVNFWLDCNLYVSNASKTMRPPKPFIYAMTQHRLPPVSFIEEDDSYCLMGIEYGLHGHLGPNGARGSPRNLRTIGKAFTAHTHSAGIVEGVYTVGVFGKLDMGYNKGPSSWSHTFGVTYANGKRALYSFNNYEPWRNFDYVE